MILIAGYPYVKENYFNTFKFYPEKDKIFFLLPRIWKAKGGKIRFSPPEGENIYTTTALFYHSGYPIIGGLLKGWMPLFPLFLRKKNFDLVYSPMEPVLLTTLYQGIWSKIFGLKHVIFTWQNIPYKKFTGLDGFIKKIILELNLLLCDGIVCGNKKAEDIIKGFTEKKTAIIPLAGVDQDFFSPFKYQTSFEGKNLEGKLVFSFAGSISYRKGIHVALKAFKEVLSKIPEAVFLIVGSGEYEVELNEAVDKLELKDHIIRTAWLNSDGLRNLLSVTDIFLYPSISYGGWEEQFGYSMAEASLMEVPVISTFSGSIEEVVIDGKTGLLAKPNDVPSLAQAMVKLGQDPALRESMGKAGREYIKDNFSYAKIASKLDNFFKTL